MVKYLDSNRPSHSESDNCVRMLCLNRTPHPPHLSGRRTKQKQNHLWKVSGTIPRGPLSFGHNRTRTPRLAQE